MRYQCPINKERLPAMLLFGALLAGAVGCGEDGGGAPTDAGPETPVDDAGDPGDAAPPTIELALLVQSHPFPWVSPSDGTPLAPVPGALVALDLPDGARAGEATTGADGIASFVLDAADWPDGTFVTATAYAEGYLMHTRVDVARPPAGEPLEMTVWPIWQTPEEMVRVGGIAAGHESGTTLLVVATAADATGFEDGRPDWSVDVPAGAPFDLVATDWTWRAVSDTEQRQTFHRWARIESEGLMTDTVLSLDFAANAEESSAASGSFQLPSRESSPLHEDGRIPYLWMFDSGSSWSNPIGFFTHKTWGDGLVEYDVEYVDASAGAEHWYYYGITGADFSIAFGRGVPRGPQEALLDVPEWAVEATLLSRHPIREGFAWEAHDAGVTPALWLLGDETAWVVELPEDATSVEVPEPPGSIDLVELLGPVPVATVFLERETEEAAAEDSFLLRSASTELPIDVGAGVDLRITVDTAALAGAFSVDGETRITAASSAWGWDAFELVDDGTWDDEAADGIFAVVMSEAATSGRPLRPGDRTSLRIAFDGQPYAIDGVMPAAGVTVEAGQPGVWQALPLSNDQAGDAEVTVPTTVPISFALDDRADRTYTAADDLRWMGSFRWEETANLVIYSSEWAGPFPRLYDDGPIDASGHEPLGATAGDHVWGVTVNVPVDLMDRNFEYGVVRTGGGWIWRGPNGSVRVPAFRVAPVTAPAWVVPAHGSVDLRLELDTAALNADWAELRGVSEVGSVSVKGSHWGWIEVVLDDDGLDGDTQSGDGVYTFVLSREVGPATSLLHDGLAAPGESIEFAFVVNGRDYALPGLPLTDGVTAWIDHDAGLESACIALTNDCIEADTVRVGADHNPAVATGDGAGSP